MKMGYAVIAATLLAGLAFAQSSVYRQSPQWSMDVPGKVSSLLAINDTLVIGAENGIYMLDYGRSQRWFHPTGASVTSLKMLQGGIVAATSDGTLSRIDPNGNVTWERTIPGHIGYEGALAGDDRGILCGSMDGFVYMLDLDGNFKWKHLVGSYVTNVYLLKDVVVAVSDRQVYILDMDSRVRLNLHISGYIRSTAVSDDIILVGMDDGSINAYGLDGEWRWNIPSGEYFSSIDIGGNITAGTREKHLMHISRDGKLLWKLNMTDGIVAVKSYQGQIYVSTLNNRLHSYNEEGVLKWYYETDGRAPTISAFDRHVLSGTTTGRVYYTYLPKREVGTSLMLSIAVVVIVGAAILLISRSWR